MLLINTLKTSNIDVLLVSFKNVKKWEKKNYTQKRVNFCKSKFILKF